jgi:hypothetical protein
MFATIVSRSCLSDATASPISDGCAVSINANAR